MIALHPRLDLAAAPDLSKALKDAADSDIALDFGPVQHLGAICLQLIISASRTVSAQGKTLTLHNTSDHVLDQMGIMGVSPEMITEGVQ